MFSQKDFAVIVSPDVEEIYDENQEPEAEVIFDDNFLSTCETLFESRTEESMVFVVKREDEEPEIDCRCVKRSINSTPLLSRRRGRQFTCRQTL